MTYHDLEEKIVKEFEERFEHAGIGPGESSFDDGGLWKELVIFLRSSLRRLAEEATKAVVPEFLKLDETLPPNTEQKEVGWNAAIAEMRKRREEYLAGNK